MLLKIHNILYLLVLTFLCKLLHNQLPPDFNSFLPMLSDGNHLFNFRNPSEQLSVIKHEFARRSLRYELVLILNATDKVIVDKVHTHSQYGYVKYNKHIF